MGLHEEMVIVKKRSKARAGNWEKRLAGNLINTDATPVARKPGTGVLVQYRSGSIYMAVAAVSMLGEQENNHRESQKIRKNHYTESRIDTRSC